MHLFHTVSYFIHTSFAQANILYLVSFYPSQKEYPEHLVSCIVLSVPERISRTSNQDANKMIGHLKLLTPLSTRSRREQTIATRFQPEIFRIFRISQFTNKRCNYRTYKRNIKYVSITVILIVIELEYNIVRYLNQSQVKWIRGDRFPESNRTGPKRTRKK